MNRWKDSRGFRLAAATLALLLQAAFLPTAASSPASIQGTVVADGVPVRHATVVLVPAGAAASLTAVTDNSGGFRLDRLEAGPYDLAVREGDRLFPLASGFQLVAGQETVLDLVLQPTEGDAPTFAGHGAAMSTPAIVGIVVGGTALTLGALVKKDKKKKEPAASPFEGKKPKKPKPKEQKPPKPRKK